MLIESLITSAKDGMFCLCFCLFICLSVNNFI